MTLRHGRRAVRIVNSFLVVAFVLFQAAEAFVALGSFVQNESSGYFFIDFNGNQQGILSNGAPFRERISVDTILGKAQIQSGFTEGYFTTAQIKPISFNSWDRIIINANMQSPNDLKVTLHDCPAAPSVWGSG